MTRIERINLRKKLFSLSDKCFWCGKPMILEPQNEAEIEEMATIEHIIPLVLGGEDFERNLRLVHKLLMKIFGS